MARAKRGHNAPGKKRAVFFDRDGTLNKEIGYVTRLAQFELYPLAGRAVREINEAGLLAFVVTNQSGIARGMFSEQRLEEVHDRLMRDIRAEGGRIDGIYYCPHHPKGPLERYRLECACRKPSPGMMAEAAARFGFALEESFVIGDRYVDVEMAHRAGATGVMVLTGFGRDEWELCRNDWPRQPDHVAENVYDAVQWILGKL